MMSHPRTHAPTHARAHTHVAWNTGSALACSWDTRVHMRHDRMRVCARERVPVVCDRAWVRACVCLCMSVCGCLCVGVWRKGDFGAGRTMHTRTQMRTDTHLVMRACAHMMTDLALLASPPQDPVSGRQSAEQPAGDGLQRADQPYVSRGEREGGVRKEKGQGSKGSHHP